MRIRDTHELSQVPASKDKDQVQGLVIVPGAMHVFEEPGTEEKVTRQATQCFERSLCSKDGGVLARLSLLLHAASRL
jgi:hypothetical protein